MYYIKFIMKNNFFKIIEYLYYFSLLVLLILYLFPGSIIGYFLYGNLKQQPILISNPVGTSVNHLFFFIYISHLVFVAILKEKKFINSFQFLFFISILLELFHYFIPNRGFQFYDLFANSLGVLLAFLSINYFFRKKK